MVSQSSFGSIIWFLNQNMVIRWFLNQNLVNYMFPNQTSAFSRYSATDSSKCASTTEEGMLLFAMLVSILWFPPPSKASWHNARESAESGGTIHLDLHRMDTLVTIR